jgi:hypothetical protein
VLRQNTKASSYPVFINRDDSIATDPTIKDLSPPSAILFAVTKGFGGDLQVRYKEDIYTVDKPTPERPNYTRQILTIMSMLVNLAAQQSLSDSSAPLRVLPLP